MTDTKQCAKCKVYRVVGKFSTVGTRYEHRKESFSTCSNCREIGKRGHQRNKKERNEDNRLWREANKEKVALRRKEYRKNNKEKVALQRKEYRKNNKEKVALQRKEYSKRYREKNSGMCSCGLKIHKAPSSVKRHEATSLHKNRLAHKHQLISVLAQLI